MKSLDQQFTHELQINEYFPVRTIFPENKATIRPYIELPSVSFCIHYDWLERSKIVAQRQYVPLNHLISLTSGVYSYDE